MDNFSNEMNDTVIHWMCNPPINISKMTRRYQPKNSISKQTIYEYLLTDQFDYHKTC